MPRKRFTDAAAPDELDTKVRHGPELPAIQERPGTGNMCGEQSGAYRQRRSGKSRWQNPNSAYPARQRDHRQRRAANVKLRGYHSQRRTRLQKEARYSKHELPNSG